MPLEPWTWPHLRSRATCCGSRQQSRRAFCCSVNWSVPSSRAYLKMMPSSFVNSSSMILASPVRLIDLLILGLMQSILSLSQEYILPSASSVPEALRVEPSIMSRMVMRPPGYGFVGKTSGFTPSFGFSSTTVPEMDIKGSSSKTPVTKPDGTKMFRSVFLNDARRCCFFLPTL